MDEYYDLQETNLTHNFSFCSTNGEITSSTQKTHLGSLCENWTKHNFDAVAKL